MFVAGFGDFHVAGTFLSDNWLIETAYKVLSNDIYNCSLSEIPRWFVQSTPLRGWQTVFVQCLFSTKPQIGDISVTVLFGRWQWNSGFDDLSFTMTRFASEMCCTVVPTPPGDFRILPLAGWAKIHQRFA